jgi:hypothetical protein
LSLAFDPAFIVSIFAMIRASEDFKRVRDREAMGEWSPLHARVRNEAVWGFVLGLARPLFLVFVMVALFGSLAGFMTTVPRQPPVPPDDLYGQSELDEVLERIDSSDAAERELAFRHLDRMDLSQDEAQRALELAASQEPASFFVEVAAKRPSPGGVANVRALGARVSAESRFRYYFAAATMPAARAALRDEVAGPDAVAFADRLSEYVWPGSSEARVLASEAPELVEALIVAALGEEEHAALAADAAFAFCATGAPRELFAAHATELVRAARTPGSPVLPLLACLDDPASERLLRAALPRDGRARAVLVMRGDRALAAELDEDELLAVFQYAYGTDRRDLVDGIAVPAFWYTFQSSLWSERYVGVIEGSYLVFADDDTSTVFALGPYAHPSEIFGREPHVREHVEPWPADDASLLDHARRAVSRAPSYGGYP